MSSNRGRGRSASGAYKKRAESSKSTIDSPQPSSSTSYPAESFDTSSSYASSSQISSDTTRITEGLKKTKIQSESEETGISSRGGARGRRTLPAELFVSKPSHVVAKKGITGDQIKLQANYFKLLTKTDWCLYQYHIDFSPEEDRSFVRKGLLKPHKNKLGSYIFDGTLLYCSHRLPKDKMELLSIRQSDDVKIKIDVRFVGAMTEGDHHYVQFFNIMMRKCLEHLKLKLIGRNYYDPQQSVSLQDYKLDLWPGYLTSIRQHEHDILMCAEIIHKVLRQETLLDVLRNCYRQNSQNYKTMYTSLVSGSIVITKYNNRTYRVEEVHFHVSPESKFAMKSGEEISYIDYYKKRYNARISEMKQPLLASRSKSERVREAGQVNLVYLIPELCNPTGLTEEMRNQFSLMKSLAEHTRVNPQQRIQKLLQFNNRLHQTPEVLNELTEWNMCLDRKLIEFPARVLTNERLIFGKNQTIHVKNADWGLTMQNKQCLVSMKLQDWILIAGDREREAVQNFITILLKVSQGISFYIERPKIHWMRSDRSSEYNETLENLLSKSNPQLVFCIVSNNRSDRYTTIKKKCCVDRPVPSQVYLQKNLKHRNLMSIATKVAIQINCKLGGAPWVVEIPIDGLMVIGFDVCHDPSARGKDYGAMVASLDRQLTKYFSIVNLHEQGEELSTELSSNVFKALQMYHNHNRTLPSRIIIYRDGVGDGQVQHVYQHEVLRIESRLKEIYRGNNFKLAFIVVSKRINTRFFFNGQNPPAGTVVDDFITSPIKYDFFIVSQQVRQGTITPTNYSIIYDNVHLDADKLQRLTYKLTHMYFNCSSTVRVPAPCHYAHKLAYLVAKVIHRAPNSQLENTLYFL